MSTKSIQMVDLQSQYQRLKPELDAAMLGVAADCTYIKGPALVEFEANLAAYLNVKHVIGVANGTDALQIAFMALGLIPGDEVIVPSFTYVATAEVIGLLRLTPVMVDVDLESFTISIEDIKKAITAKTKAIVPVHLYGQSADMEAILAIAKEHQLYVIEDNAQAIGSDFTFSNGETAKTGTLGDIGCTSFFPSKNLGCFGDGGAMFTNDDELASRIRMIANHGQSARYYHDVVGCNSRLDSIQAAVLNIKLQKLDSYNNARNQVGQFYNQAFADIKQIITPAINKYSTHVYHQYTIQLVGVDREKFIKHLADLEIPCMIYYPVPGHLQKMFGEGKNEHLHLPVTNALTPVVCSLPIHTEMEEAQLKHIASGVNSFFNA